MKRIKLAVTGIGSKAMGHAPAFGGICNAAAHHRRICNPATDKKKKF